MENLVLLRHGESDWNSKGLFTGWVDVPLSGTGADEARTAGGLLRDAGIRPDVLYTSVLTRAIQTAHIALEAAELLWLPVRRSWRLNERHYGALQGKDKGQTRDEGGGGGLAAGTSAPGARGRKRKGPGPGPSSETSISYLGAPPRPPPPRRSP